MMGAGQRRKAAMKESLLRRIREQMSEVYKSATDGDTTYARVKEEEEQLIEARYPGKKQNSYKDIPIFPFGYNKENLPSWGRRFKELTNDYLPSNPSVKELQNFYLQIGDESIKLASLLIPSSAIDLHLNDVVPVTPVCPPPVDRPLQQPALPHPQPPLGHDDMEVDDHAQGRKGKRKMAAAKVANLKAAKVAAAAKEAAAREVARKKSAKEVKDAKWWKKMANATNTPSKTSHEEEEEEKPKLKPDQDTYQVIRTYQHSNRRYLEVFRQNSDGYIIGWRLLYNLDDYLTAHWCFFSDFAYLMNDLSFLNIRILPYGSGYGNLDDIYYGEGTLDVIIDEFLSVIYDNPEEHDPTTSGKIYFYIICLLFGEAPRLQEARKFVFDGMKYNHYECQHPGNTQHKLGSAKSNLIKKWSNTCESALYLLLVQLEKAIKEKLIEELGPTVVRSSFQQFIDQFEFNKAKAHDRCDTLMNMMPTIFHLTKEQDLSGKYYLYDETALYQLLNEQLHLVKHNHELVTSILLRRGCFRRKIVIPGLKYELKGIDKKILSADAMFWEKFDTFTKNSKVSAIAVMNFLEHARPFLVEFGFRENNLNIWEDVEGKCEHFMDSRLRGSLTPMDAAEVALGRELEYGLEVEWGTVTMISEIVEFLRCHKPEPKPEP